MALAAIPFRIIGDYLNRPPTIPPAVISSSGQLESGDVDPLGSDESELAGQWPEEEWKSIQRCESIRWRNFLPEEPDKRLAEEKVVRIQWGLRLPNGEVHWDTWSGISFFTPLDRLKMVATLQKTALDMGLNEGDQTKEFLNKYSWQTREQTSRISYCNTVSYALTDPAVSAAPEEIPNDDDPQGNSPHDNSFYPHRDLHPGFVGGDA
jgi:hypothetical protein